MKWADFLHNFQQQYNTQKQTTEVKTMSNYISSVQCSKGHWYDPSITSTCPQCAAEAAAAGKQAFGEATQPVEDIGETVPVEQMGTEHYGATEPVKPEAFANNVSWTDETQPATSSFGPGDFSPASDANVGIDDYAPTMPASMNGIPGFTPVTGWLVCIDGPAKGADYRIHTDYNFIGRDPNMDICIRGDNRIGRDRHATIVYDPQERLFFFGPQNAKSVVRVNNRPVIGQVELKSHDILTIGSTRLLFVPLCDERFNWDE